MTTRFLCDFSKDPEALPHFWEHCVGSGRAALALRADWQAQLKQCREDLGFRHVRFHGLLDDDVGVLDDEENKLLYAFQNVDKIYDFLRSIHMRPNVELSFMPRALASGDKTVYHYKANVTPPADYGEWATLVSKLASHWIDRYGASEVSNWPIEVWNEPNMPGFWTGSREDYFRLFEVTWKALKHVHPALRVGGPVTAKNEWIGEFIEYCEKANVPPDFISTHNYPTDAMGSPGDETKTALSKSHLGILRERAEATRKQAGKRTLYYTEWSSSSNPRDELHDDPYAAAYLTQALLDMGSLVQGYSWWTFSDIFEENYFPIEPFHGGFGLMNIQGIPKPAYRAFEILHRLGEERFPVEGSHKTVQVWAVRGGDVVTVVIVNLALPKHPIEEETVEIELFGVPKIAAAQARRIDAHHANAKAKWKLQGEPRYPSPAEVDVMIEASRLQPEDVDLVVDGKALRFEITLPPQSVVSVELQAAASKDGARGKPSAKKTAVVPAPHVFGTEDERLLEQLQSSAFGYFTANADPGTGLVADNTKKGSPASVATTGFALSCYPIAVERGWLGRGDAAATTLKTLQFFADSRQGEDAEATGYHGFYYHFLDMQSGKRARGCELSTIDTAMLLAGAVVAAEYFDRGESAEKQIRALATELFERADWRWTLDSKTGELNQAWTPEEGFRRDDWEGYTEALVMYVMGAASPSHPMPRNVYDRGAKSYRWRHNAGLTWIHATPLFIHLFPQAWIDLRELSDGYVDHESGPDYFENSRRAIAIQRVYAFLNPYGFAGYGKDIWGLSACEGPDGARKTRDGRRRKFLGYAARGMTDGPDDGTLVPWAAAACVAHAPEEALAGVHAMLDAYPRALRDGRFVGAINPTLPGDGPEGWIAPGCFGLDQGLVVMMIENARSGLVWTLTRNSTVFRRGLKNLGFGGGWLD
ncbi:MAG: GH39 family glycosyl hydrolase [Rhodanobacteraceae bacterium]